MRLADLVYALRMRIRPYRRTTSLGPLLDALHLRDVVRRIGPHTRDGRVLGPDEFASYVRVLTPLSPHTPVPADLSFDAVVVRQEHINALAPPLLLALHQQYICVHANARYAIFEPRGNAAASQSGAVVRDRIAELVRATDGRADRLADRPQAWHDGRRAVLVTTFNRPAALRRSLPQLTRLGCPVLVVDDGSADAAAAGNLAIADATGARYIRLPENRGLSGAMNVGLSYLLADPRLEWLSYLQDDVDVDAELLDRLRLVEDAAERPLLTGYDADEHAAEREDTVNGVRVLLKRSSPAVHLHAHRAYWTAVLPIPSEYLGAPRRRWEASLEDYWIVNHAPASAGRRGLPVVCVPGLVRTFLWHHADSTWGNPNLPDPPLAPERTRE